ncbi:membrane protein insertion efficiency factor YidD [Pokkaliibacter sp. CJK22405]|uniref:membrane protein insertion efficiency factor YidD n=1 Tax=Pokkaliibacter sp. CJK22405 TaxID=3384615 RepID=UPI0039848142
MCRPDPQQQKANPVPRAHGRLSRWLIGLSLGLLKLYQWLISPLLGNNCRYMPTCSEYAIEAFQYHGFLKGGYLTLRRLLRCHPFARSHGWDPVPGTPDAEPREGLTSGDSMALNRAQTSHQRPDSETPPADKP